MQAAVHWSPGFCIHGHRTGKFHALVRVSHTSRTADVARGPADAMSILSQNCANTMMRPVLDVHTG